MKKIRSHFVFSKSQQNGIFLLVIIIIVLQGFLILPFDQSSSSPVDDEMLSSFQMKIDSLKNVQAKQDKVTIAAFNPNFITDFKGYTLGMSAVEIDRLLAFRSTGKWINSNKDFQEVTKVSDSLLMVISPYFKFPEWTKRTSYQSTKEIKEKVDIIKQDINSASKEDLQLVNGIGDVLANRIIKYRIKINGFRSTIQLKDVYGLSREVREKLEMRFGVSNTDVFPRLNINKIGVLELAEVPYFNYELAREIIDYRQLHEEIRTFEELAKIKAFPSEKIDRIPLYLTLK